MFHHFSSLHQACPLLVCSALRWTAVCRAIWCSVQSLHLPLLSSLVGRVETISGRFYVVNSHTHTTHWIGTGTKMLRKNWSCGYWGSIATVTKLVSSFTRWSHANLSILRGCFLIFCNLKNIFCSAQHLFPSSDSIRPKHSPSRTCKETRLFRSFSYFFNLPKSTKYLRHTFPREKPISHTSFTSWPTLA